VPRERLLLVAVIFIVIGVIWAVAQGSWAAAIVGVVAVAIAAALSRVRV